MCHQYFSNNSSGDSNVQTGWKYGSSKYGSGARNFLLFREVWVFSQNNVLSHKINSKRFPKETLLNQNYQNVSKPKFYRDTHLPNNKF